MKEVVLTATRFYSVEDNAVWTKRGEPHRYSVIVLYTVYSVQYKYSILNDVTGAN